MKAFIAAAALYAVTHLIASTVARVVDLELQTHLEVEGTNIA